MFDFIKFLFSPTGPQLTRRHFWSAIFLLLLLLSYAQSQFLASSLSTALITQKMVSSSGTSAYFVLKNFISTLLATTGGWPAPFLLLLGSFLLAFRMLSGRGISSKLLKTVTGVFLYAFLSSSLLFSYTIPYASTFMHDLDFMAQHARFFSGVLIVSAVVALIGGVVMLVLAFTAPKEARKKQPSSRWFYLASQRVTRIDFMLANFRLYIYAMIAAAILGGASFLVKNNTSYHTRHIWLPILAITALLVAISLMIPSIGLLIKRVRSMGRSPLKILGLFFGVEIFLTLLNAACLACPHDLVNIAGEKLCGLVMLSGHLFFLFLALSPEASEEKLEIEVPEPPIAS